MGCHQTLLDNRTSAPSATSLRGISASPEAHRRLSPELRGGILQAPWPNSRPEGDCQAF